MNFRRAFAMSLMFAPMIFAASFAGAQVAPSRLTLDFIVPSTVDPPTVLIFTDTSPIYVNATDLFGPPYPAVEVHSQIPGPNGGYRDITSFTLQFYWNGLIDTQSFAGAGFTPWSFLDTFNTSTKFHSIKFTEDPGSAPINDNYPVFGGPSFATLTLFPNDPTAQQDFIDQNQGRTIANIPTDIGPARNPDGTIIITPGPGTMALFLSLGVTGSVLAFRRRKRK